MPIVADVGGSIEKVFEGIGELLFLAFAVADVLAIAAAFQREKVWRWALYGPALALAVAVFLSGFWRAVFHSHEDRTMFWHFLFACASMVLIFLVPLMWRRKKKGPAGPEGTQGSAGGGP